MFRKKPEIAELVVKFLPTTCEEFSTINPKSVVLLTTVTNEPIDRIKLKIESLTNIPAQRQILLYCGTHLTTTIPNEAFESLDTEEGMSDIAHEDREIFKARIHVGLLPKTEDGDPSASSIDPSHHTNNQASSVNDEEIVDAFDSMKAKAEEIEAAAKRKKKQFNLKKELDAINCGQFADALTKAGYTSKGVVAALTEADLAGPGLWIPRRAAMRILQLAADYKEALQNEDQENEKNARHALERELLDTGAAKTVGIEGMDGQHQVFNTKAEIKRAWEAQEQQKAIDARNQRLRPVEEVVKPADETKRVHSAELAARIETLRRHCAELDDEEEGEEDYYSVASLARRPGTPLKTDPITLRNDRHIYCCDKHRSAVRRATEDYIARRKVQHLIEFEVLLGQVESHRSGFVRSSTLLQVARERLAKYRYDVPEIDLRALVFERCAMDLSEQRASLSWIDREEMAREHLATLLPVKRFSGKKFVAHFSDMLEQLDRLHLTDV